MAEVDLGLGVVVEGGRRGAEDGPVRVLAVVSLEGQSDGLGRACHFPSDPPRDFDQAHLARPKLRHATGAADDLILLRVGQLAKLRAPFHLAAMLGHEPLQAALQEPHLGPAVDHEPTRHQALPPPPRHRAGGDVVFLAHLADREHRLGRLLHRLPDRGREVLHELPQVAAGLLPLDHQGRPVVRPEPGDPEAEVFVGVSLGPVDLAEELLGPLQLLQPPFARGVTGLLILELLHRRVTIRLAHPTLPATPPHRSSSDAARSQDVRRGSPLLRSGSCLRGRLAGDVSHVSSKLLPGPAGCVGPRLIYTFVDRVWIEPFDGFTAFSLGVPSKGRRPGGFHSSLRRPRLESGRGDRQFSYRWIRPRLFRDAGEMRSRSVETGR